MGLHMLLPQGSGAQAEYREVHALGDTSNEPVTLRRVLSGEIGFNPDPKMRFFEVVPESQRPRTEMRTEMQPVTPIADTRAGFSLIHPGTVEDPLRIVLIMPRSPFQKEKPTRLPLGVMSLASCLRDKGYMTKVALNSGEMPATKIPSIQVTILDLQAEEDDFDLAARLKEIDPDMVGVSAVTPFIQEAVKIAGTAQAVVPKAVRVLGGAHVSALEKDDQTGLKQLLDESSFHMAVLGQGEQVFPEAVLRLSNGMTFDTLAGVAYKHDLKQNEPVTVHRRSGPKSERIGFEDYPLPSASLDLVKQSGYARMINIEGKDVGIAGVIMTSLSCPFNCTFCASKAIFDSLFVFSSNRVIADIKNQYDQGIRAFYIADDNFLLNKKRSKELATRIRKEFPDIHYSMMTRADSVDEEVAADLKLSGCQVASIGVETGDPVLLQKINKRMSLETLERATQILQKNGIHVKYFLMVGLPGQDWASVLKTAQILVRLRPDSANVAVATPYPGSQLFRSGEIHVKAGYGYEYFLHEPEPDRKAIDQVDVITWTDAMGSKGIAEAREILMTLSVAVRQGDADTVKSIMARIEAFASGETVATASRVEMRAVKNGRQLPQGEELERILAGVREKVLDLDWKYLGNHIRKPIGVFEYNWLLIEDIGTLAKIAVTELRKGDPAKALENVFNLLGKTSLLALQFSVPNVNPVPDSRGMTEGLRLKKGISILWTTSISVPLLLTAVSWNIPGLERLAFVVGSSLIVYAVLFSFLLLDKLQMKRFGSFSGGHESMHVTQQAVFWKTQIELSKVGLDYFTDKEFLDHINQDTARMRRIGRHMPSLEMYRAVEAETVDAALDLVRRKVLGANQRPEVRKAGARMSAADSERFAHAVVQYQKTIQGILDEPGYETRMVTNPEFRKSQETTMMNAYEELMTTVFQTVLAGAKDLLIVYPFMGLDGVIPLSANSATQGLNSPRRDSELMKSLMTRTLGEAQTAKALANLPNAAEELDATDPQNYEFLKDPNRAPCILVLKGFDAFMINATYNSHLKDPQKAEKELLETILSSMRPQDRIVVLRQDDAQMLEKQLGLRAEDPIQLYERPNDKQLLYALEGDMGEMSKTLQMPNYFSVFEMAADRRLVSVPLRAEARVKKAVEVYGAERRGQIKTIKNKDVGIETFDQTWGRFNRLQKMFNPGEKDKWLTDPRRLPSNSETEYVAKLEKMTLAELGEELVRFGREDSLGGQAIEAMAAFADEKDPEKRLQLYVSLLAEGIAKQLGHHLGLPRRNYFLSVAAAKYPNFARKLAQYEMFLREVAIRWSAPVENMVIVKPESIVSSSASADAEAVFKAAGDDPRTWKVQDAEIYTPDAEGDAKLGDALRAFFENENSMVPPLDRELMAKKAVRGAAFLDAFWAHFVSSSPVQGKAVLYPARHYIDHAHYMKTFSQILPDYDAQLAHYRTLLFAMSSRKAPLQKGDRAEARKDLSENQLECLRLNDRLLELEKVLVRIESDPGTPQRDDISTMRKSVTRAWLRANHTAWPKREAIRAAEEFLAKPEILKLMEIKEAAEAVPVLVPDALSVAGLRETSLFENVAVMRASLPDDYAALDLVQRPTPPMTKKNTAWQYYEDVPITQERYRGMRLTIDDLRAIISQGMRLNTLASNQGFGEPELETHYTPFSDEAIRYAFFPELRYVKAPETDFVCALFELDTLKISGNQGDKTNLDVPPDAIRAVYVYDKTRKAFVPLNREFFSNSAKTEKAKGLALERAEAKAGVEDVLDRAKASYSRIAADYAKKWHGFFTPEIEAYLNRFLRQLPRDGVVLDAGTGPGRGARWFVENGRKAVGIDNSAEMIAQARAYHGDKVTFEEMDFRHLRFDDGSLAGIWADSSFHHLPEAVAGQALDEFRRTIRPDGVLFMTVKAGQGEGFFEDSQFPESRVSLNIMNLKN